MFLIFGISEGVKERTLAEGAPEETTRNSARIISVKETPVILSGGLALVGTQPFTEVLELDGAATALPDTRFAGKYGDKNLFYAPCGMEIKAGSSGLVVKVGRPEKRNDGRGGYVSIQNAYTMRTVTYSHLSEIRVSFGDFLEKGETLGTVGLSGDLLPGGACQVGVATGKSF